MILPPQVVAAAKVPAPILKQYDVQKMLARMLPQAAQELRAWIVLQPFFILVYVDRSCGDEMIDFQPEWCGAPPQVRNLTGSYLGKLLKRGETGVYGIQEPKGHS